MALKHAYFTKNCECTVYLSGASVVSTSHSRASVMFVFPIVRQQVAGSSV
jgi:hypothetical protein